MGTPLPLPAATSCFTNKDGTPSATFYSWLKSLGPTAGGSGGITILPGTAYFVSASGSDTNNGRTSGAAFSTIQKAFDVILGSDLNGTSVVTINVGAGTFAGWSVIGPARGWTGDQQTGAPLGAASILVLGAGSGSTNINPMVSDAKLCIGNSGGLYFAIQAMNINVPGSGGTGLNCNTYAITSFNGDVSFTGGGDGTGHAIFADASGFVFNGGVLTLKGTLTSYFDSSNTANYESVGGSVVITGTIGSFASIDILANMHGETVSVSGGTTTATAYQIGGNSVLELANSLTGVWGELGILSNGGRTEGACDAPTINGAPTGLGTGSASIAGGSNAYGTQVVLSPTGAPGSAGTVTVQINEKLTLNEVSFSPYVVTPSAGSGTWSAVTAWISAVVQNPTNVRITISWFNNGVNLTAGSTYLINLIGQT